MLGSSSPTAKVSGKRKAEAVAPKGSTVKKSKKDDGAAKLAKLTSVQGVLKAREFQKVQKFEQQLGSSTMAQLRAELVHNYQVSSGKKGELVQRVAEGRALGTLPPCPRCEKGQIHWSRVGGWYSCPGYYDGDVGVQKRCYFRSQELMRGKWKVK